MDLRVDRDAGELNRHGMGKGAETFRTSLYFHRSVHDVLREIAFTERRTISDLIWEGLDLMLTKRGYPTTAELKERGRG